MEVRLYNPKKLDLKTISGYFIGYCVGLRDSRFYCLSHTTRVIEPDRAIYLEDDTGTSQGPKEIVFKEHLVLIHVPSAPISSLIVDQHLVAIPDDQPIEDVDPIAPYVVMDISLRRLERAYRPVISDDYIVNLHEHECDVGDVSYSTTYKEVIVSPQSNFWIDVMKDEMTSMSQNKVWSLVDFPDGYKHIG